MSERYDAAAARHYAAYRPPLHRVILSRALGGDAPFAVGVDVGSGTGYSAVALAEHCDRVYGVEPSGAMRARATPHGRVAYLDGSAERLPLPDGSADVVTFAGSLAYVDRDAARRELARVCRGEATIVVYDFEVLLEGALRAVGDEPPPPDPGYDHAADLSGSPGLREVAVRRERTPVPVTAAQLAHLLLSDSARLDRLARRLGDADPFGRLEERLRGRHDLDAVEADLYWSVYRRDAP